MRSVWEIFGAGTENKSKLNADSIKCSPAPNPQQLRVAPKSRHSHADI